MYSLKPQGNNCISIVVTITTNGSLFVLFQIFLQKYIKNLRAAILKITASAMQSPHA